jgi:murein DD-endopeptidase MepM/ murein hydrolase activator NlpD
MNVWPHSIIIAVLLLLPVLLAGSATSSHAQTDERCFAETGHCIGGRLRAFWEQNDGLRVFGLPITPQQEELVEGTPRQVQWFERTRLELHPENAAPYDVLLGRLGIERLQQQGQAWQRFDRAEGPQEGCRYFAQTGQNICGDILAAWRANGLELDGRVGKSESENVALFGLPLSGPRTETLSDGQPYTVQWFERARFELHPQEQPPYNVQLGLLAREVRGEEPTPGSDTLAVGSFRYAFPVRAERVDYGRYHHDYPAADIFCAIGSEFVATTSGVVDWVSAIDRWDPASNRPAERGGMSVAIIGDDGWRYYGSHLSGVAEGITPGVRVEAGQLLGWTGKSGNARSTPPHLHYGISRPTTPDDWQTRRGELPPYDYLRAWQRGEMVTPVWE